MKEPKAARRNPQVSIALAPEDKKFIEKVAKARGLSMSALLRTLAYDEGRRLGIADPSK
ncbi:plasmid mobilization protein [Hymenobacter setariae]|uniref:plasmid mobilization protein n=1 Tax=Hymenobacter setariae TaxID=2594794 RepID=UPI001F204E7A|nr:hypothetical protein [Hymenobacter setariae]